MAALLLWAIGGDLPVKVLAVLGGAAAGAGLAGWMTQMAVKGAFGQNLPRWPAWGIRGLGGLLCGWLVALWVFGGSGGGLGGEGGWGLGGKGGGDSKDRQPADKFVKADKDSQKNKDEPPPAEAETIRVEVLGDAPLKKIAKGGDFDPNRRYRVAGEPTLRTLAEIRELIRKRRGREPPLRRLEIIVYLDSPARERPVVADLADWARDLEDSGKGRLRVDFSESDRYAPVE